MQIVAVGINHHTAPVEVRERVMIRDEDVAAAASLLKQHVAEGAILSTCNRTEVYATSAEAGVGVEALKAFLADASGLAVSELGQYLYTYTQERAVKHLFSVASGINSLILGESEIMGQVRDALVRSSEAGAVGVPISRLFHGALRTGRLARQWTAISRQAVSVSSAGVQMARQVFGGLEHCKVLVISAGEAGALTARCLKDNGAAEIGVANRTRAKATELADQLGGRTVDFDDLSSALADFDVVISATASSRYVVSREGVAHAMEARGGRPLCLIDIAVPRDIDPDSRNVENVYLYDIDDLESVSLSGMHERQKAVAQVEGIVDAEAGRFMAWFSSMDAMPVVRALAQKAERVRKRELDQSLARLSHLSEQDRQQIDALTKALMRKLLHDPIMGLKALGHEVASIEAARKLFRLDDQWPPG